MCKWLTVLAVAAGLTIARGIILFVVALGSYMSTIEHCGGQSGQIFWPTFAVLFHAGSAFMCVIFYPVVCDAMNRAVYKTRFVELNVVRLTLVSLTLLEGALAVYWGMMSCQVLVISHENVIRIAALVETLFAGIILCASIAAQRGARRFILTH